MSVRLGTVGEIGLGRELALDLPGPGPWLVLVQVVDPGKAVNPEIQLQFAAAGGGYAHVTRQVTVEDGYTVVMPGAGRAVLGDPGAVNTAYRASIAAAPYHPPRWGLNPETRVVSPNSTTAIVAPPFAVRGRVTLVAGSLTQPANAQQLELPPITASPILLTAGPAGATLTIDWEGWF